MTIPMNILKSLLVFFSLCASVLVLRRSNKDPLSKQEQLGEMDGHVSRLQDALRCEQAKVSRAPASLNQNVSPPVLILTE